MNSRNAVTGWKRTLLGYPSATPDCCTVLSRRHFRIFPAEVTENCFDILGKYTCRAFTKEWSCRMLCCCCYCQACKRNPRSSRCQGKGGVASKLCCGWSFSQPCRALMDNSPLPTRYLMLMLRGRWRFLWRFIRPRCPHRLATLIVLLFDVNAI